MKRLIPGLLAVGLALTVCPAVSQAQLIYDHLKCYKIKDSAKFKAEVDLTALQQQFGMEQCAVKGKGALFCIMVDKAVTKFEDKSKPPLTPASFAGQELLDDRICYKMKCPKVAIDPLSVTDQFGTRTIGKFKPAMLCTPAFKTPPQEQCADVAAPACAAECPDGVQLCAQVPGTTICGCQDPCELGPAPMCGGPCPDPADSCVFDAVADRCTCGDPTVVCDQGLDPAMCATGTTCPAGQVCDIDPTGAICQCQ